MADIIRGDGDDFIPGTSGRDDISAGGGNDSVFARGDNDTLNGGDGNDFLSGEAGNDFLFGPDLSQDIRNPGRGEIDRLVGGDGADLFSLGFRRTSVNPAEAVVYYNDGDSDTNGDDDFAVLVDFDSAEDTVVLGGDREDYVVGPSPRAFIATGDSIFLDTNKNGLFDQQDELIAIVKGSRNLNLDNGSFLFEGGNIVDDPIGNPDEEDDINEPIQGTPENDSLTGDDADNIILGLDGNDTIKGLAGDDSLSGGAGRDRLLGEANNDVLDGGSEKDIYTGGSGDDTFVVSSTSGKDVIQDMQNGNDIIQIVEADLASFEDLSFVQKNENTQVRLDGTTIAVLKNTKARGFEESDFSFDVSSGLQRSQAPSLETPSRSKPSYGMIQGQEIIGSDESEALNGNNNDNVIRGKAGDDTLNGRGGDDQLIGDQGDDTMKGGKGNDQMVWNPGDGSDRMLGGADQDTAIANGGDQDETFTLGQQGRQAIFDRVTPFPFSLNINSTEVVNVNAAGGNDSLAVSDLSQTDVGRVVFKGGDGNDTLTADTATSITAKGDDGDDTLIGGTNNDKLQGGSGDDTIDGNFGDDIMRGNDGGDRLIWNPGGGSDTMNGGAGADTTAVNGGSADEQFTLGQNGNKAIFDRVNPGPFTLTISEAETMEVNGFEGNDSFTVSNVADTDMQRVVFNGGEGNDVLDATEANVAVEASGQNGDDILTGSSADDSLTGGAGVNTLRGNGGRDRFVFGSDARDATADTIADFSTAKDQHVLIGSELGIDQLLFQNASLNDLSGNNNVLILQGGTFANAGEAAQAIAANDQITSEEGVFVYFNENFGFGRLVHSENLSSGGNISVLANMENLNQVDDLANFTSGNFTLA